MIDTDRHGSTRLLAMDEELGCLPGPVNGSNPVLLTITQTAALLRTDRQAVEAGLAHGHLRTIVWRGAAFVDGDALWSWLDPQAASMPAQLIDAARRNDVRYTTTVSECNQARPATPSQVPRSLRDNSSPTSRTAGRTLKA